MKWGINMGSFKDELNKAVEEAKEILGSKTTEDIKSSTKEAVDEAKEIVDNLEQKGIKNKLSFLSWHGRLNRVSFFIQAILLQIMFVYIGITIYKLRNIFNENMSYVILIIIYIYFCFIILSKRFHDFGKSTVYAAALTLSICIAFVCLNRYDYLFFIYLYGALFSLSLKKGDNEANKYGEVNDRFWHYIISETKILSSIEKILNLIEIKIVECLNNVTSSKFYKLIATNKRKVLVGCVSLIVLLTTGYYLYIPKMSDVEKYRQEKNVAGICELIDKTFKPLEGDGGVDKYREVRSSAIIVLAEMRDSKGVEYLEKKVLDKNIWDYEVKCEMVKALINADSKYLENLCRKYTNMADNQKAFDEKINVYDELNKFAIYEVSKDYISAIIYKDALKNLNNDITNDKKVCDYINQKIFPGTNYLFTNKSTFEKYSKLVNLFSGGYENHIIKEIDSEIEEARKTINSVNSYFSPLVQESIRETTRQIYALQGQEAALEYINETFKTSDKNIKSYWEAQNKINKLNYRKNHIDEERVQALKEKNRLYDILHSWANRYENKDGLPINTLNINWEDSSAYINNLQFVVRGDNGDKVYKASSINAFNLSDLIPENISVIDNKFIFKKNSEKLIEVELSLNANDFSKVYTYLNKKYGKPLKDEASKERYFSEWRKDKLVLQLRYNKAGNSNTYLRCIDREIFEQRP